MQYQKQRYSIWIEAEEWSPGQWTPNDDNSDVIVEFENGKRWIATFFSYQNIISLKEKNRETGEYLGGKHFCATDIILVDEVSRERIEEVVAVLLKTEQFDTYFALCGDGADVAV
jgi:hypothetical protein